MTTFQLVDAFVIREKGVILVGQVNGDGNMEPGDLLCYSSHDFNLEIPIQGIEIKDPRKRSDNQTSIVVSAESGRKIAENALKGSEFEVKKPIRGQDKT